MPDARNYRQVLDCYNSLPAPIKKYFREFAGLVTRYSWEVSYAYIFSRIELAKNMTIYCSIVKLHKTNAELTRKIVNEWRLERRQFYYLFKNITKKHIPKSIREKLEAGEKVRDKIVHGKQWKDSEVRTGLIQTFNFANEFNDFVFKVAGFKPFGNLRGFKGRAGTLSMATTRWILKGMGFDVS